VRLKRWALLAAALIGLPAVSGSANPPHDRSYYESRGDIIWEAPTQDKRIALTFDDGPDPASTPEILDLLRQYGAKATFFTIGRRVDAYPDVVKREIAEGHEVANHTYNHVYFGSRIGPSMIRDELAKADQAIWAATGRHSRLFRPPGGYYNDTVVGVAKKSGYTIVLWSWHQDTKDWRAPGVAKIAGKVLNNARNGDIVLMHDHVRGSRQTVEALKIILPELKKRGYEMVTVSELTRHLDRPDGTGRRGIESSK
jgi:polysaccharide deacetylase family sporulation protein PdaB